MRYSAPLRSRKGEGTLQRGGWLHPFDHSSDTLTQADTHGGQAELAAFPFQYVQQGAGDTGTGAAQRVTQGDGAAVQVHFLFHFVQQLQVLGHRQGLGSERFVQFISGGES